MPGSVSTCEKLALSEPILEAQETLGTTLLGETLEEESNADEEFWNASTMALNPTVVNGNLSKTSEPT